MAMMGRLWFWVGAMSVKESDTTLTTNGCFKDEEADEEGDEEDEDEFVNALLEEIRELRIKVGVAQRPVERTSIDSKCCAI
jgi:hypothetical protein